MADPLDRAIELLSKEVDLLLLDSPKEGTMEWWTLRAKSTGLSLLRTFIARGMTDPKEADAFRKDLRQQITAADPVVVEIVADPAPVAAPPIVAEQPPA